MLETPFNFPQAQLAQCFHLGKRHGNKEHSQWNQGHQLRTNHTTPQKPAMAKAGVESQRHEREGKAECLDKTNNQSSWAVLEDNPQHFLEVFNSSFLVSK